MPGMKFEFGGTTGSMIATLDDQFIVVFVGLSSNADSGVAELDEIAGVVAGVGDHAIPEPEGETVGVWDGGRNSSSDKLKGIVVREDFAFRPGEVIGDIAFDFSDPIVAGGVGEFSSIKFLALPVSEWFVGEDGFGVIVASRCVLFSQFAGEGFERSEK